MTQLSDLEKGDRVEITWPDGVGQWRGTVEHFDMDEDPATGLLVYRTSDVTVKMDPNHRPVDDDYMDWDVRWLRKLSLLELIAEASV